MGLSAKDDEIEAWKAVEVMKQKNDELEGECEKLRQHVAHAEDVEDVVRRAAEIVQEEDHYLISEYEQLKLKDQMLSYECEQLREQLASVRMEEEKLSIDAH